MDQKQGERWLGLELSCSAIQKIQSSISFARSLSTVTRRQEAISIHEFTVCHGKTEVVLTERNL